MGGLKTRLDNRRPPGIPHRGAPEQRLTRGLAEPPAGLRIAYAVLLPVFTANGPSPMSESVKQPIAQNTGNS